MKKTFGEYYLGFDIGTDSIGWAATTPDYKLLKLNGKSMWGIHLFNSGETAKKRRTFRQSRRRTQRRVERVRLLQSLFEEELEKTDPLFLQRLSDSKFHKEDKKVKQKNALFNDNNLDDKAYYEKYPTIYHLRSQLIHSKEPHDIRLVYLAIHHIIKHRGHFLYEGQEFSTANDFNFLYNDLINTLNDYEYDFSYKSIDEIKVILQDNSINKTEKKKRLAVAMGAETKQQKAVTDLLSGSITDLSTLFNNESLKEAGITKLSFLDSFEDKYDELSNVLQDNMYIIEKIKAIYDWSVLVNILKDNSFISDAKKAVYEEHKTDLDTLKKMAKEHLAEQYSTIFFDANVKNNYCNYIGKLIDKSQVISEAVCSQADFCAFLKKMFEKKEFKEKEFNQLYSKIEANIALPKQVVKENSVIPYQLNLNELEVILDNASTYLPFLLNKDESGLTVSDKIKSILTFRIPYYVGPLNPNSKFAWIEKKENEKIYPWNFDDVVDKFASANKFIENLIKTCTYLPSEKVLPKNSLLYSKFSILNQLNNLKINGEKLNPDIKMTLFNDLYINVKRAQKVTVKKLKSYLKSKGLVDAAQDIEITGIDEEIQGTMKSYIDLKKAFEKTSTAFPDINVLEDIIYRITALGESSSLLKSYLSKHYKDTFSDAVINDLSTLTFSGWGRLSSAFLTEIYHIDELTGECFNIINMLENSQENLNQLLGNQYSFSDSVDEFNHSNELKTEKLDYSMVENLYVSPAVKRSIWRTMCLAQEVVKVTEHAPDKIFIEFARQADNSLKGKKTASRKKQLQELYKNCITKQKELYDSLESTDEGQLRNNRLFLYYTQMGRCMYSGDPIVLSEIFINYDIDHIYPQSKVKDDSLDNTVLVKKALNGKKGDHYPIPENCLTNNMKKFWKELSEKKFISKEKYIRLTRNSEFSETELSEFINRQLVETRQSTKAVAKLMENAYPDTNIVYVKAGNVSDFRHNNNIVKSRLVNDFHHAKDAYLNIVVGNVYDTKFTSNPLNFIKSRQRYSMNKVFDFNVERGGKFAWIKDNDTSLTQVKKTVSKNNILFTRYATQRSGGFFKQNPLKKGKGQYPLKTSDSRMTIEKYGGYDKVAGAYFFLVDHIEERNGKGKRTIEYVPIYLANTIQSDNSLLLDYCTNVLKLKEPKILIPKIKLDTLFKVDGFFMHLSSRTGSRLIFKGANQLLLSEELYAYAKRTEGYVEKNKKDKTEYPITNRQKITVEQNLALYDELTNKLKNTIYKVQLSAQITTFENGREIFSSLSLPKQCEALYNAITLFGTSPSGKDLTGIGGKKDAGILLLNSNITKIKNISIIYQSVTGLFEKEVNLKEL